MNVRQAIAGIVVGDRCREDMGDMAGLRKSLRDYGLIDPIIVQRNLTLVHGLRRLRAAQQEGWMEIEVVYVEDLDPETRLDLERELDARHKMLTEWERAKQLVAAAQRMGPALAQRGPKGVATARGTDADGEDAVSDVDGIKREECQEEFLLPGSKNSGQKVGRPSIHGSTREDVANALGVARHTLVKAEEHVAAVAEFPELAILPQKTALRAADALRKADEATRRGVRQQIADAAPPEPPEAGTAVDARRESMARFRKVNEVLAQVAKTRTPVDKGDRSRTFTHRFLDYAYHITRATPQEAFAAVERSGEGDAPNFLGDVIDSIDDLIPWLLEFRNLLAVHIGRPTVPAKTGPPLRRVK